MRILLLLALASTAAAQDITSAAAEGGGVTYVDRPEALTFYTPPKFMALIGFPAPAGPQPLSLCSFSPDGVILARAEWTDRDGKTRQLEAYLNPVTKGADGYSRPDCRTVRLEDSEAPGSTGIRTSWQAVTLGERQEYKP